VPFVRVHAIEIPSKVLMVIQGEVDSIDEALRDPGTGDFYGFSDSNTMRCDLCPKHVFDKFIKMWPGRKRENGPDFSTTS
jgi:hypothetical protein